MERAKILFIGAGSIAQSMIHGISLKNKAFLRECTVIAPSNSNFNKFDGICECLKIEEASEKWYESIPQFEYVFFCIKPHIFQKSVSVGSISTILGNLIKSKIDRVLFVSVMAGITISSIHETLNSNKFQVSEKNIVRIMTNTAAQICRANTSVFWKASTNEEKILKHDNLIKILEMFSANSQVIRVPSESLIDVTTGLFGSGIAFVYEIIQAISDVSVESGLSRRDSTISACQLLMAGAEMVLTTKEHPIQLRDNVISPAGTTASGLRIWHEQGINTKLAQPFRATIERAKELGKK